MDLTPRQRAHLKGLAHRLKPVAHLGKDGLTAGLVKQLDEQLTAHELIKVKIADGSPLDRHQASEKLPPAVNAFFVQNIGKIVVLYRPHPDKPRIALPWPIGPDDAAEIPHDIAEARRPVAREPGTLTRSVRDSGPTLPGAPTAPARPRASTPAGYKSGTEGPRRPSSRPSSAPRSSRGHAKTKTKAKRRGVARRR